jgi:hypothetical protein
MRVKEKQYNHVAVITSCKHVKRCTRRKEGYEVASKRKAMTTRVAEQMWLELLARTCGEPARGSLQQIHYSATKIAELSLNQHHSESVQLHRTSRGTSYGTVTAYDWSNHLRRHNAFNYTPQYAHCAATSFGSLQDPGNHSEYVRRMSCWRELSNCASCDHG